MQQLKIRRDMLPSEVPPRSEGPSLTPRPPAPVDPETGREVPKPFGVAILIPDKIDLERL